ncbi:sugar phosphate isomerase/epimerase [Occultella glacieicola]|uniref:Sugar phosphate isomerase/epimerase n=1 Tax=Occultella glacieicola TaxID=2518684 RepID=A0ABY2E0R2_9MICO|nr:sugar phosphate isomerase/epimerase family protein [Occultella glacieicola]TDE89550.1 sugar phosphate isomerase/epimerase [Occultella glacieicola]
MSTGPRVSVATICFDGFGDENFEPTFAHAPALGIREIEFNTWYPRNLTPAGLDSVRQRSERAGLRPATLQVSPFAPGPDSADLTRESSRWLWLLEAAERLGVGVIKATGSARGTHGGLDAVIDLLRVIAPIAAERGLTIAVENHANNVLEHPEDYDELFAAIGTPAVGMCLDTGHFAASGHDPVAVAGRFADRLVHLDLKDCAGMVDGAPQFVRFGHGTVDFDATLATAVSNGYTGYLVIELPLIDRATMAADLRAGAELALRHTPDFTSPLST